jgi:8-oxo-dGTP diphosphatase
MSESVPAQPRVLVDIVVFQLIAQELYVLLTRPHQPPYAGRWALPGDYLPEGISHDRLLERVLKTKTGVLLPKMLIIEQLYTFDTPATETTAHNLAVTYMGLCRNLVPVSGKTTETPQFFAVDALPENMDPRQRLTVETALERLRGKLSYTNAIFALVPKLFTFAQLQSAYEVILGQRFDKRNFRKKFLSMDLIQPTTEYLMEGGAHRPAKLYRFHQQKLQYLDRTFD